MSRPDAPVLNVLLLEDREDDAALMMHELRSAGMAVRARRVQTEAEYRAHLSSDVDVILADYSLPKSHALTALDLLKEQALDIPFIVVSGTIGDEAAVEALRRGAVDYLLKDRLGRLGEAVKSALRARDLRRQNEKAVEALSYSEERYRKLVHDSLQGIVVAQDGRMVFCNQAYADMMGYTVQELLDLSPQETVALIHPEDRARVQSYHHHRTAGAQSEDDAPARYEFRVIRKDGSVRWHDASATRTTYRGRHAALVFYVDVTERKEAEEVARQQQARERVEAILDAIGEGVVVLDRLGIIEQANPAFEMQTGYDARQIRGQHYRELLSATPSVDARKVRQALATVFRGQPWHGEATVLRRDGSSFEAALTTTSMRDKDDRVYAFVVSIRDISRMKEMERMKDSIISIAAHELRTPLTTIGLYSDALCNRQVDAARRDRYIQAIQAQTLQLKNILDNMLDLARLEAGRGLEIVPEPVDICGVVDEIVHPFAEMVHRHTFEVDTTRITRAVPGDPLRLAQVLRNIVPNAVKYSPNGGKIRISGRDGDGIIEISVADEGVGIAREQQPHLFEEFYRADSSYHAPRGTGLGLAISRLIVEGHGGRIWVCSEEGIGSTFTFTLPSVERREAAAHSPPASGSTGM